VKRRRSETFTFASAAVLWLLSVALLIDGEYASAVTFVAVGLVLVSSVAQARAAYLHGWFAGRGAMLGSLAEAERRGLTVVDWITAEAERDAAMMPRRRRRR
jgi:hypothetical protein